MAIGNIDSVSSMLARMTPQQRQQFAMMHHDDPFMVSLAKFVNDIEKEKAQALRGQQAMGQPMMPPVVQQEIAQMAPPQAQPMLPEDVGIGALPAPNMERMAGGGITGEDEVEYYADKGYTGGGFDDAFNFVMGVEGEKYVADDAGKGPSKFGINAAANPDVDIKSLTKDKAREIYKRRYWDAIGGDALAAKNPALAKAAFDTAVNMGVGRAKQLVSASGGDPAKLLELRSAQYNDLVKSNPERFGKYASGWDTRLKKLNESLPLPSAQAASTAAPAAPEPESGAGTTAAPATGLGAIGAQAAGISALAAKELANVGSVAARESAGTLARRALVGGTGVPGAAMVGGAGLTGYAGSKVAEMSPEQREEFYTNPMIGAMGGDTALAAAIMNAGEGRIKPPEKPTPYFDQMGKALGFMGKAVVGHPDVWRGGPEKPAAAEPARDTSYDRAERAKFQRQAEMRRAEEQTANLTKDEKKQVIDAAKEAAPEAKKKGFEAEDWLQLGLGLMANKSPYFMQALGEAGLGVLKARQEARKEEREDVYRRALAEKASAEAGYISEGTKGATAALQNARQLLASWEKTNANLALLDPQRYQTERRAAWEDAVRESYTYLGLEVPAGVSSATSALPAVPQGVKVRQIGG